MDIFGKPLTTQRRTPNNAIASSLLHLLLIAVLIHQRASWVAPIRLPGSPHGTNLLLTYSPGKAPLQTSAPNPKTPPKQAESTTPLPPLVTQKPKETNASPTKTRLPQHNRTLPLAPTP
jgi:periplasmic protein TonB